MSEITKLRNNLAKKLKALTGNDYHVFIIKKNHNGDPEAIVKIAQYTTEKTFGIPEGKLGTRTRKVPYPEARFFYFNTLKEMINGISLNAIGKQFGMDHSSVVHGLSKFDDLYTSDRNYRKKAEEALRTIKEIIN